MKTDFLNYYDNLPDSMTPSEVKLEFEKLLDLNINQDNSVFEICDAIYELADRQYHTYSILDENTKKRIANWVKLNWIVDFKFISNLGMIAGGIGIREICNLLKAKNTDDIPSEIKKIIEDILNEIESHIDNPYWDLKNTST